jgi:hypothetical protein
LPACRRSIDICNVIYLDQHGGVHKARGNGPDGKDCEKAEDELIGTALNICRARVCEAQNLDSSVTTTRARRSRSRSPTPMRYSSTPRVTGIRARTRGAS